MKKILDDHNYENRKLTVEERSKNVTIFKAFKLIHLGLGLLIIISELCWIYAIILGFIELGKMPTYGDSRAVINEYSGISYKTLSLALDFMVFGIGFWLIQFVIVKLGKIYKPSKTTLIIGLIGIVIFLRLITSKQFEWIQDYNY